MFSSHPQNDLFQKSNGNRTGVATGHAGTGPDPCWDLQDWSSWGPSESCSLCLWEPPGSVPILPSQRGACWRVSISKAVEQTDQSVPRSGGLPSGAATSQGAPGCPLQWGAGTLQPGECGFFQGGGQSLCKAGGCARNHQGRLTDVFPASALLLVLGRWDARTRQLKTWISFKQLHFPG